MPTLKASEGPNGGVNLCTALAGNVVSTNVMDRGAGNQRPAMLRITSVVGATPTVTVAIEASPNNVDWYPCPYATTAAPETPVVAPLTITTAVTTLYTLRPDHPWRFLRTNHSANTNVTLTVDVFGAV